MNAEKYPWKVILVCIRIYPTPCGIEIERYCTRVTSLWEKIKMGFCYISWKSGVWFHK